MRKVFISLACVSMLSPAWAGRYTNKADPDYFELTDANDLVPDFPFSVAGWFYPFTASSNGRVWYWGNSNSTGHYYAVGFAGDAAGDPLQVVARGASGDQIANTTAPYTAGEWNHFTATFEAEDSRRIWLNDANTAQSTDAVIYYADVNCIAIGGMRDASPGLYAWGFHSHYGVWDKILDANDRSLLYSSRYAPSLVSDANLVAHWALDEDSPGSDAVDSNSGDFTLTAVSNPGLAGEPGGIITSLAKILQNLIISN